MAKKNKLAQKVAKETGVDEKYMEILPDEELAKLDALVPDSEEGIEVEEVDVDELNQEAAQLPDPEPTREKICVGVDPITKEEVYI